ncbi:MAG: YcxB family protein [Hyphomonadaceae bacterium]
MTTPAPLVEFTVTLDDVLIRKGVVAQLRWAYMRWHVAAMLLVLIALAISPIASGPIDAETLTFAAGLALFLVVMFTGVFFVTGMFAVQRTLKMPGMKDPVRYALSNKGIAVEASSGQSQLSWAHYVRAKETPEFFLIALASRQAHIIPKAQLSEEQAARLRGVLAQFIKRADLGA